LILGHHPSSTTFAKLLIFHIPEDNLNEYYLSIDFAVTVVLIPEVKHNIGVAFADQQVTSGKTLPGLATLEVFRAVLKKEKGVGR